jgi:hypothetical protein
MDWTVLTLIVWICASIIILPIVGRRLRRNRERQEQLEAVAEHEPWRLPTFDPDLHWAWCQLRPSHDGRCHTRKCRYSDDHDGPCWRDNWHQQLKTQVRDG